MCIHAVPQELIHVHLAAEPVACTRCAGRPQKIRFDCNNQRKYVRYFVLADFMLIDLTETYTMHGLEIPSLNDLTAKPYFSGALVLQDWH